MSKPVSSYPPEFHDIWALALAGTLNLTFASRGTAINFKQRLYTFRKRLAEEAPLLGAPLYEVDIGIEGEGDAIHLISFVPSWKAQVRELKAKSIPSIPESMDHVASKLADLGFTSKDDTKN